MSSRARKGFTALSRSPPTSSAESRQMRGLSLFPPVLSIYLTGASMRG